MLLIFPFMAKEFNLNLTEVSILRSVFNVTAIVFTMPTLFIINKFSNKKILLISDLVAALSFAALGFAQGFFMIIVFRILWSISMTLLSPIPKSEVAKLAPVGKMGEIIGNIGSVGEIGRAMISTICGYLIIWLGWQSSTIWIGSSIAVIVVAIMYFTRKEKYVDQHISGARIDVKKMLKNRVLNWAYICSMMDNFASSIIPFFLPFLILFYNYDVWYLPVVNVILLIGAVVGRSALGGLADKHRPGIVFAISEVLMGFMALILGLSNNIVLILLAVFGIGLVTKGTLPITSLMIINSTQKDGSNKSAFTVDMFLVNITGMISATLFGMLGDVTNVSVIFIGIFITSLFAAVCGLVYNRIVKNQDSLNPNDELLTETNN